MEDIDEDEDEGGSGGGGIVRPWDKDAPAAAAAAAAAAGASAGGGKRRKGSVGDSSPLDALFQMASKTFEGLKAKSGRTCLVSSKSIQFLIV